jgi:hypothetical protein
MWIGLSRPPQAQTGLEEHDIQLGFKLAFGDKADPPNYVGLRADPALAPCGFAAALLLGKFKFEPMPSSFLAAATNAEP